MAPKKALTFEDAEFQEIVSDLELELFQVIVLSRPTFSPVGEPVLKCEGHSLMEWTIEFEPIEEPTFQEPQIFAVVGSLEWLSFGVCV